MENTTFIGLVTALCACIILGIGIKNSHDRIEFLEEHNIKVMEVIIKMRNDIDLNKQ